MTETTGGVQMNKRFLSKMEKRLKEMQKDILANLAGHREELVELRDSDAIGDEMDRAGEQLDSETLGMLGMRERNKLESIRNALERIQSGSYGKCVSCGQPIPYERLEAMPDAVLCLDCKRKTERPVPVT